MSIENKEIYIVCALIEVKQKRMSKEAAISETFRQRYLEPETIEYLDDLYQASNILFKNYEWFREGSKQALLELQRV